MTELFQKSALDELSTPEQLNQQIKIMKPNMWLGFLGLVTGVVGFLAWAFLGNINETTQIDGIVFPQLGVEGVIAKTSGNVQDVLYANGEEIQSGDIIAVIPNEDCLQEIKQYREELEETTDNVKKQKLKDKITQLNNQYEQTSMVRATKAGTLQNVVSINAKVEEGEAIASVLINNQASNSRQVVGYLPLVYANQLKEGTEAQVCPAYAEREKYGYMKGYVSSIGTMPVTEEILRQYYGNLEYAKDILPEESCVEIRISLYLDEESKNFFSWSNEKGEELTVDVGTICDIQIVTDSKRPIELLFP